MSAGNGSDEWGDVDDLRASAVALRDQSDALNRDMHAADVTDGQRDEIAARKREIDEQAFDLEQKVRILEEAEYGSDAVSKSVAAAPLNMNGGGF